MAAETAIASTQKTGQGDAVVLGNNTPNVITTLLKRNEQEGKAKAQGKLLTQKQTQDNKAKFFQNLSGLKDKVWYKDIPEITQKVTDLVGKAVQMQKSGVDPFDPANTAAYTEIFGDVEKIGLLQGASKSAEERYNKAVTLLNQDKEGIYDKLKLADSMKKFADITNIEERAKYDIPVEYAPVDLTPKLKTLGENIKAMFGQAKVFYDEGNAIEYNKSVADTKLKTIAAASSLFQRELEQGRITPEKLVEETTKFVDSLNPIGLYSSVKDDQLAFQKEKEAHLVAYRNKMFDLKKDYQEFRKSQSLPIEFDTKELFESAGNGNQQAISLIQNSVMLNKDNEPTGAYFNVISGKQAIEGFSDNNFQIKQTKIKDNKGNETPVDPESQYFVRLDKANGKKYLTKVTPETIKLYVNGETGTVVQQRVKKDNTSNLSQDEDVYSELPLNAKQVNTVSNKSGNTTINSGTTNKGGGRNNIPEGTMAEWKAAGWSDAQIKTAVSTGKIKVK